MFNSKNKKDVVKMLNKGYNINEPDRQGNTILHRAVVYGDTQFVSDLIDLGADARIKNILGETPIFYVSKNKDVMLKLLIDKCGPILYTDFNKNNKNYFAKILK